MTPDEILSELSYADGLRLLNQSWLSSGQTATLRPTMRIKAVSFSRLFG